MADKDDQQSNIGAADSTSPPDLEVPKPPKKFGRGLGLVHEIIYGSRFANNSAWIKSVSVDGQSLDNLRSVKVGPGSEIIVIGGGLNNIDVWEIKQAVKMSPDPFVKWIPVSGRVILNLSDVLGGVVDGAFEIYLFSTKYGGGVRKLPIKFLYKKAEESKDASKKGQTAEGAEDSPEARARAAAGKAGVEMFTGAGSEIMAGAVGGLVEGFVQKKQTAQIPQAPKPPSAPVSSGGAALKSEVQTAEDMDVDVDVSLSGETQAGAEVSGSGEVKTRIETSVPGVKGTVQAGRQTISQGSTVQAGSQTIGQGGTVQVGGQTIRSGTTVQGGAQIFTGGTVSAETGGIKSGGGTTQVSGKQTVSSTESLKTTGQVGGEAKIETSVSGEIRGPGETEIKAESQAKTGASGKAEIEGKSTQEAKASQEASLKTGAERKAEAERSAQPLPQKPPGIAGTAGMGGTFGTTGTTGFGISFKSGATAEVGLKGEEALKQAQAGGVSKKEEGAAGKGPQSPAESPAELQSPDQQKQAKEKIAIPPQPAPLPQSAKAEAPVGTMPEQKKEGEEKPAQQQPVEPPPPAQPTVSPSQTKGPEPKVTAPPEMQNKIDALRARGAPLKGLLGEKPSGRPPSLAGGTRPIAPADLGTKTAGKGAGQGDSSKSKLSDDAKGPQEALPPSGQKSLEQKEQSQEPEERPESLGSGPRPSGLGQGEKMPDKRGRPLKEPTKLEKQEPLTPEEKPASSADRQKEADRLARNQGRALKAAYQSSSLIRNVAKRKGIDSVEKLAGLGSSQIWRMGLLAYLPTFTISFLVLDIYWFLHWRNKQLFPMAMWKKIVTVILTIFPFFAFTIFVIIFWYTACNIPGTEILRFEGNQYSEMCKAFNESTIGSSINGYLTPKPTAPSGARCSPVLIGPATTEALQSTCLGNNAAAFSILANVESGGGDPGAESGSDKCKDGNSFSIGLYQINLIAHGSRIDPSCAKEQVFVINGNGTAQGNCLQRNSSGVCLRYDCQVIDSNKYLYCKNLLKNPAANINYTCRISNNGGNLQPWAYTKNLCGL